MSNLPQFLNTVRMGEEARPRAPRVILHIPPSGRMFACPSIEAAENASTLYASAHPGFTVAIYTLHGYAYRPIETPDFTPANSDKAAGELISPIGDTDAGGLDDPPEGHYEEPRPGLSPEQVGTLQTIRDATREQP